MSRLKNFNPYAYIEEKKYTKILIFIFVILAVFMKIFSGLFSLKGWISVPQFSEIDVKTAWFDATVADTYQLMFFKAFFSVDYVWAFLLVFLLSFYVYKKASSENKKIRWFYWLFLIIGVIAYVLDCIENTSYLMTHEYPKAIATYKEIAYAIVFVYVVLVVLYFSVKDRFSVIRDFVTSAWISLLFLAIIGLTLPKAPQVNSIIVDLYYHPFWFVVVLLGLFAPLYGIVLSHYPSYFLFSRGNKRIGKKNWRIHNPKGFFGIIWYSSDSKREKVDKTKNFIHESSLGFLRRTLGVFFYVALFYMIAYTTDTNFDTIISISNASLLFLLISIWWLYELKKKKDRWYIHCKSEIIPINFSAPKPDENGNKIPSLHIEIRTFIIVLALTIIAHVVLFIFLLISKLQVVCPYTYITVVLSLFCIILQTVTYMYYRTFRSVFKNVFFNAKIPVIINSFIIMRDKSYAGSDAEKQQKILDKFEKNELQHKNSLFQRIAKIRVGSLSFGSLSNNIIFLKIMAYFGFLNAIFLVVINIVPTYALKINSIIILLSYFYLFYGMIVILLKHFIFYKSKLSETLEKERNLLKKQQKLEAEKATRIPIIENENLRVKRLQINRSKLAEVKAQLIETTKRKAERSHKRKHFLFFMNIAVLLLIVLNFLARFNESTENNLFELAQIEETAFTPIDLEKYAKNLPEKRYYIGCYGGGMKANAWTMTVLNALDKNNDLYDKTACLSGASGGTIGLINYSVIKHNIENKGERKAAIRNIGTENILSMDLTHVFGRDLVNHILVPLQTLNGKDRSTSAMKKYAEYSHFDASQFNTVSYRQYWRDMYMKNGKRFPILISNTTDIKGKQGMAVSVKIANPIVNDILYAGASDILAIEGKTLSFYNAVSTTNRFPLISPAAAIKGKGQYNDGGIYENSGLLSAFKLYEVIDAVDTTANTKTSVFINIVNDKTAYVKSRLDAVMERCKGKKLGTTNEISAILNSVAATEMFPGYIKDKLKLLDTLKKDKVTFESIYLPHRFDFDDVKMIYGDDFKNLDCINEISDIIESNTAEICKLIKEDKVCEGNAVIEPEMSRVMAIPAFEFMQSMLRHSSIQEKIKKIEKLQ